MKPFLVMLAIPVACWADLAREATIRRDTFGVPHILAESEEAAAFAMGYAQAEDHCVDIARRFVAARGEEAKFFGTNAENDFKMKRYENHEVAERGFHELTPLFQRMLDAYAAGFNRYVEKNRKDLPDWMIRVLISTRWRSARCRSGSLRRRRVWACAA